MMWGSLRGLGIVVTRERVRNTLRSIDPIGGSRRWPANVTTRRPYSVPGPNSLWHIGKTHSRYRVHFHTTTCSVFDKAPL